MNNDEQLNTILAKKKSATSTPYKLFQGSEDAFWLWVNTEGYRKREEIQQILPSMPDKELQSKPIGGSGDETIKTAFKNYQTYRQIIEEHLGSIDQAGDILDFGVGWGRMLRLFLRDTEPQYLWGTDVNDHFIKACKMTNKWCNFDQNGALPPTSYQDGQFSVVYSFSVFSHLGEVVHKKWLKELRRILRPGGLMIASTWHRGFIQWCADSRNGTRKIQSKNWQEKLATIFLVTQFWLDKYDNEEFCFEPYASDKHPRALIDGVPSHGETCIPKGYLIRNWTKFFDFVDFIDDRKRCAQNIIVMRK